MANADLPAAAQAGARAINVEVAYARPDVQVILPLELPAGSTLEQAIHASGILERFPEIDLNVNKVSVYGKLAKLDQILRARDRVEINRPLIADPRQARKQRAGQQVKAGG